ncbi:MAG: arginine deiminase family protein [Rudaea sp.]
MLTRAIVRPPAESFAAGLTTAGLGAPVLGLALEQHARYCATLERCGLDITALAADADFPDSTFVEDTAIVTADFAILTRPGAAARAGEVGRVAAALEAAFDRLHAIAAPGTVDGGDVCQADNHFFIGLSERTNEAGARQLSGLLMREGLTSSIVDMRGVGGILHLKSAFTYLGDGRIVAIEAIAEHKALAPYEVVRVARGEGYAANLLRLNEFVVIAAGFPRLHEDLDGLAYAVETLDMSEFRKMDGALTCLSLRF